MMKKLKFFICLTAVLLFSAQALLAQSSATLDVTNGRFATDVDNFFSVNDWADLGLSKWFSYLKMEDIELANNWEAGFGLKTTNVYLGFYYEGMFNTGTQTNDQVQTIYNANGNVTNTWPDISSAAFDPGAITHDNLFGILLGYKNMGWQFTINQVGFDTIDLPHVQARTAMAIGIPAGSEGSYRSRQGTITPKLTWGMAEDITVGKFTARPSAGLALEVTFSEEEYNLTAPDGEEIHIENFNNNQFTPILSFDTNGVPLWSGDWGSLKVGFFEEFQTTIFGNGTTSPRQGTDHGIVWNNTLAPYATFSYDVTPSLSMGAKLNVPINFGGSPQSTGNSTVYNGYFGVGLRNGVTLNATGDIDPAIQQDLPTLGVGFQYTLTSDGLFRDMVDKLNIHEKVRINWGILAYLPGYLYQSNNYQFNYNAGATTVSEEAVHTWQRGENNFLQICSIGLTFVITPNFVIDAGYTQTDGKVLISVKY